VLIGAPGAGKSSVLEALTTLQQLARGSPLLEADAWITQLAAVIALQRQAGRTLFLIAATTKTADELRGVISALGADSVIVVCLRASPEIVAARIAEREPDRWPGKQRLIGQARRLAQAIPLIDGLNLLIDTEEREADDVAGEIHKALTALDTG
jgi:chloramphenicol 3-O-phosphotransferase